MKEYIKNIYFIEETQNIEGSYIEVKTLFVNEDKTKALDIYKKLASKKRIFFYRYKENIKSKQKKVISIKY